MRWHRAKEGYFSIDHRASPGTKEIPAGQHYESATATCVHCSIPITLDPKRTKPKEYCPSCDGYICYVCASARKQPGYVHMNINKFFDEQQRDAYRLIQNRKM